MNLINLKTILFFILAVALQCGDAYARTLTVNFTSKFGGSVFYSNGVPIPNASIQVLVKVGTLSGTNTSWTTDSNGVYANGLTTKNDSFQILNIPAGTSYTVAINYTFTVFNPWGLKSYTFTTQKTKTFTDLSSTAVEQTRTITPGYDLLKDFTTPFNEPTTSYGTVNQTSSTGVSNLSASLPNSQDGSINLVWNSQGTAPTDHWIVATEASLPLGTCSSGFRLGTISSSTSGFSVKYYPEKKNVAYNFRVCPIYSLSTSYCGTSTDYNPTPCQAGTSSLAVVDTKLEVLSKIQVANNFSQTASLQTNWSGVLGESWYLSTTTGKWFYYVPKSPANPNEGKLYIENGLDSKTTFIANRPGDDFQVELATSTTGSYQYQAIHEDLPISIKVPIALGNIPNISPEDETRLLEWDISTSGSNLSNTNWSQIFNEKWLLSSKQIYSDSTSPTEKNKGWLFMLPNGATYRWDGVSSSNALKGTFYAKYPPMYYDNLEQTVNLQESWIQRIYGFETTPSNLNFSYDYNGNYNASYTHYYEKWVRSKRNMQWYYILPSGQVYRFVAPYPIIDGDKLAIDSLGYSSYRDPSNELINFPY